MPLYNPQTSPVIADASLTIAKTNGLQTALDTKPASTTLDNIEVMTQAAYDALGPGRPSTTEYNIVG